MQLYVLCGLETLPAPVQGHTVKINSFCCKQHLSMWLKQHCWHNSWASVAQRFVVFLSFSHDYLWVLCNVWLMNVFILASIHGISQQPAMIRLLLIAIIFIPSEFFWLKSVILSCDKSKKFTLKANCKTNIYIL